MYNSILYNERMHLYADHNGNRLISVTEWCKKFQDPFNAELISAVIAKKEGIPAQEVLDRWEKEKQYGSYVHGLVETGLRGELPPILFNEKEIVFVDEVKKILSHAENALVYSELMVGSLDLGLAGRIDLMTYEDDGFVIWDIKTSRDIKYAGKLKEPFQDCKGGKLGGYQLQLSCYAQILMQNGNKMASKNPLRIIWVDRETLEIKKTFNLDIIDITKAWTT